MGVPNSRSVDEIEFKCTQMHTRIKNENPEGCFIDGWGRGKRPVYILTQTLAERKGFLEVFVGIGFQVHECSEMLHPLQRSFSLSASVNND